MEEKKLTFGYWGCQALGHPTRLLLAYHKVDFEDVQYTNDADWFKRDKPELKTAFPNLPYLKDGDYVITESSAIIQYAALKTGNPDLLGKNMLDSIVLAQIAGVLRDLMKVLLDLAQDKEYEKNKGTVLAEKIALYFEKLSKSMGEKEYCLDYITYVDFLLYYQSSLVQRLDPEFLKKWPNILKHHDRILNSEGIQAYRKSPKYPKYFETPGFAAWSGEESI